MHTTPTAARPLSVRATPQALRNRLGPEGFTLIELLVVLTVIGILASVSYPAYTAHTHRTYRAEARAVLLEASHYLERYHTTGGSYKGAVLPDRLTTSPPGLSKEGSESNPQARYQISIAEASASSYRLSAKPTFTDDCGELGLDQAGRQTATKAGQVGGALSVETCWR